MINHTKTFFVILLFSLAAGAVCQTNRPLKGFLLTVIDRDHPDTRREEFISYDEIKALVLDTVRARSRSREEEKEWIGTAISGFLEEYSIPRDRVTRLEMSAPDGYMSVLSGDLLQAVDSGLFAWAIAGKNTFPEQFGPLRLVFPDLYGMYWVNQPGHLTVYLGDRSDSGSTLILYPPDHRTIAHLSGPQGLLPSISLQDLLKAFGMEQERFSVLTSDSLLRQYRVNTIIKHMLLQKNRDGTFRIDGVNVPVGLKTDRILFICAGTSGIFLKTLSEDEARLWQEKVLREHYLGGEDAVRLTLKTVYPDGQISDPRTITLDGAGSASVFDAVREAFGGTESPDYLILRW